MPTWRPAPQPVTVVTPKEREPGYHFRGIAIAAKICSLLRSLKLSTYDEISPNIEYWIEHALTKQSIDANDLVERISPLGWDDNGSETNAAVARFLKDFYDAPHRSERSRSFVDGLCSRVLWWFTAASAEDLAIFSSDQYRLNRVAIAGGESFVRAASFVGYLIERGLLGHELVRQHLVKPLIAHHYTDQSNVQHKSFRASAIYQLLVTAGDSLVQGLLDPGDVQVCFETLNTESNLGRGAGFDAEKLQELRKVHTTWLGRGEERKKRRDAVETERHSREGEKGMMVAEVPTEVETPVAFAPQDLPITTGIAIPPSIFHNTKPPPDSFTYDRIAAVSSPTLSISTVSDLTPTELGDNIEGGSDEQMATHHETFYFEDGDVEIVCGRTVFRVHSTTVSFSSQKLREILSQSALLHAPMPEGCPRITVPDTAQDFTMLFKMIYTPGFPGWRRVPEFAVFASLLRMTAKYGFSDVHEQLVDAIKSAYPTKWEGAGTVKVLGEHIFGLPEPHPNAVLNLFLEQKVKFALPFATYRAAIGGLTSLTNNAPGMVLPPLTLASTIYGMEAMRGGFAHLAHLIVWNMSLGECSDGVCVVKTSVGPPKRRIEELNKVYDAMVKEAKGDVLFSLSLGDIVCASCAKVPKEVYNNWCTMVWEELPRVFRIGESWDDL